MTVGASRLWGLVLTLLIGDAIALPPERPKHVPFNSLYVEASGALVAGTDYAAEKRIPGEQPALYRSVDGRTAERMNIKIDYSSLVDVQAGPDGSIFLVTRQAIHRSDDSGKTWRKLGRDGID